MSQRVNPVLFNNQIYINSKWFNPRKMKFSLNEDLQIREIINIIFKQNLISQYIFVDHITIYKYATQIKLYIYFICNFNNFIQNLNLTQYIKSKNSITSFFLYYKYFEMLQIKKLELIKVLRPLLSKQLIISINMKNLNMSLNNSIYFNLGVTTLNKNQYCLSLFQIQNFNKINIRKANKYKHYNLQKNFQSKSHLIYENKKRVSRRILFHYQSLTYFKTLHFLLYMFCYSQYTTLKPSATSLLNLIFFELDKFDNTTKNYNYLFYTFFNLLRDLLTVYLKDDRCNLRGIRIQIKGRYFLTKRKKIFILNLGSLNLNQIDLFKDYSCVNLIKSTGASSIKVWIVYKTKCI